MAWWWWIWLAAVVFLLLLPLVYGWGFRGWGPPYPRGYRGRRHPVREAHVAGMTAWGLLGDLVWVVLIIAVVWLLALIV